MTPYGNLMLKDLADALQAVPGKVIVILESCGSGAAVYANGGSVGNECAKRFTAFGCRVTGVDLFPREDSLYKAILPLEGINEAADY